MELRDYLRLLRRRWRLITMMAALGAAAGVGLTLTMPPSYQATAEVFVSLRDGAGGSTGAYQGNLYSQDRVKSYAQIVDSPAVTDPVARQLGLPAGDQSLGERIRAVVPTGTVLVDIVVTDGSPARARDIANATATRFGQVVRELEKGSGREAPVSVTTVRPAVEPGSPVSPRPVLNTALGLLLGLGLGVGVAVAREALDTTVRTPEDLRQLTAVPTLGEISFDAGAAQHPLVVDGASSAGRSESFRSLRTNLRFVDVDQPPQVVVVTSAVEAEGKSTTACNLALTLATAGVSVALVEGDLRRPRVADYLGLEGAVGLTDVLVGRQDVGSVLQPWGDVPLTVLPSGAVPPNPSELLGSQQMRSVLDDLRRRADIVLIDAPPLLPVTDAAVLAQAGDGAILVVRHGRTTREQIGRAASALAAVNARVLGTVLTMVPVRGPLARGYASHYYYEARQDRPVLTAVPPAGAGRPAAADARGRRGRRRAG